MKKHDVCIYYSWSRGLIAIMLGASVASYIAPAQTRAPQQSPENPTIQKIREQELAKVKITMPFTLATGGDIIEAHPISQLIDPDVRGVFKLIQGADAGFANMESNSVDFRAMGTHVGALQGPKDVPEDVRAMGFQIVQRASNHSTDMGTDEMLASNKLLEQAGLVFSGSGRNLEEARAPHYYDSPKGRIGVVSMFASATGRIWSTGTSPDYAAGQMASYQMGNAGGLPGVNVLRVTPYHIVTSEELESLRKIKSAADAYREELIREAGPLNTARVRPEEKSDPDRLNFFGAWYKAGEPRGGISYKMNSDDLRDILRNIRNGKEQSDFMIASIHTHESPSSFPMDFLQEAPTDFLVELAHKAIDNGADVFVGTGVHVLRPVEIYKGRPIFYGLMSFVHQFYGAPGEPDRYEAAGLNPFTTETTETEFNWQVWGSISVLEHDNLKNMESMESMVAQSRFEGGQLVEVRLYPIEFGYNEPFSQKGIPRIAHGEVAQRILEREQRISKPFGTKIDIEGEIGVIRVGKAE
jgi:poly-gamma-glutamate capsule biosynthesis protein CapA/YwtB (metallophosphatase superfamily)